MKKWFVILLLVFGYVPALAGELRINITDIEHSEGNIRVALFDNAKKFPSTDVSKAQSELKAQKGSVTVVFAGIVPGRYAVALYHDENGNKKLDQNFLGIPKEGYGFSRDARGFMGPPKFSQSAFDFNEENSDIVIEMRYP